jgi:AraC-like DNA-binding protein
MNARENPPFDSLAKTAKEDAKTFDNAIFRFMSLEDRKRSSLKVKEIGKQLGFENEYYFSRSFKMCVGTSPRNYANGT